MRCPFCGHDDSQVKDSRPTEDGAAIRRRRQCEGCGARLTTFERIQLRELTVLKSEGRREPFEREKLERSVAVACRKRPIDQTRIDKLGFLSSWPGQQAVALSLPAHLKFGSFSKAAMTLLMRWPSPVQRPRECR